MSQESPVTHDPRAEDEHHEGHPEHLDEQENLAEQEHPEDDNPFTSHGSDDQPTQEFTPQLDESDEPTRQFETHSDVADDEPTQEFDPSDDGADSEPTEVFVPEDNADDEPTQEFVPSDGADSEPTEAFVPTDDADDEPTQEFVPQADDPEPTMALPVTDDSSDTTVRPRSQATPSQHYQRQPVFSPRGFDPVPEAEAPPAGPLGAGAAAFAAPQESPEQRDARIMQEQADDAERARAIEAENARRREAAEQARQRSLGTVTPDQQAFEPERQLPPRRSTDKWFASLGIFLLRIVLAGILAIRGYQMITDIPGTRDLLTQMGMPYLDYLPWGLAIVHGLAALALVFGLGVRVVGLCVTALAGCALALVKWGVVPVFQDGMPGFNGELEVLVAAVGFVLFTLGSGGWGMDAGWRHNRWRDKYGTA
ncbi:DoxX family membrane protein [Aestuariimicrobium sp. Y1814]|uniref:DoxX family protein n=1 Tax=Aestuariimicrobium sp. Y1814 TaxID=3418742 RepID=UPI003DA77661